MRTRKARAGALAYSPPALRGCHLIDYIQVNYSTRDDAILCSKRNFVYFVGSCSIVTPRNLCTFEWRFLYCFAAVRRDKTKGPKFKFKFPTEKCVVLYITMDLQKPLCFTKLITNKWITKLFVTCNYVSKKAAPVLPMMSHHRMDESSGFINSVNTDLTRALLQD